MDARNTDDAGGWGGKDPNEIAAFVAQNIPVEVEVYPADHGWCPPDSQVFDQVQADRAWGRLLATFKAGL